MGVQGAESFAIHTNDKCAAEEERGAKKEKPRRNAVYNSSFELAVETGDDRFLAGFQRRPAVEAIG